MKIKLKNTLYFCWDTLTILSKILKSNDNEIALDTNWYLRYCKCPTDIKFGIIEPL